VAEKVAEVAPAATVTEAGTVSRALFLERETTAPPVGAALLRVTVQVEEALEVSEAGLQERLVGTAFVTRLREKVTEEPESDAVMTAVLLAVMVEAVAEKVAEVAPAATVTEAGTVSRALFLERETTAPPVGAALLRVTVQVEEALEVSEAGLQERLVGTVFVTRLTEKVTEEPESDAVMTAVLSAAMVEAVAEKVAEVAPAATVTEAGTVSAALLSERETTAPPVGAALLRVTVQVAEAPEVSEAGLQERLVGTVLVSRPIEKVTEEPESDAVMTAVLLVVIVEAVAEKVAERAPAATVTEAGTVNKALFLDREMTAPPAGAGLLRATVQVLPAPEVRVAGVQLRPVSRVGASRLREKVAVPPAAEAVMVADVSAVTRPEVAEKVAEEEPAWMVMEEGTVTRELLLERVTTVPPVGAA
jgi:ribosomal protein S8E